MRERMPVQKARKVFWVRLDKEDHVPSVELLLPPFVVAVFFSLNQLLQSSIMKCSVFFAVSLLASLGTANKFLHLGKLIPPVDAEDESADAVAAAAVNTTGSAFFTQLLDHDDPSKGTFQQKFWWNSEFWAGPGSPVSAGWH